MDTQRLAVAAILTVSCALHACGGGGGGGGGTTPPSSLSYSNDPAVYPTCGAIADNVPTIGGGAATAFSVSPALPAGLTLDAGTGVISGTPTAAAASSVYTITASNSAGSVMADVDLEVTSTAPSALAYGQPSATYVRGFAIADDVPSLGSGTANAFAVTAGALPVGLVVDPVTGVISGTPLFDGNSFVTITASNCEGLTTSANLSLSVDPPAPRGVYAANAGDDTISMYVHDPQTGMLRPNGYEYAGAGAGLVALVATADGRFVYAVANGAAGDAVHAYAADTVTARLSVIESESANVVDPVAVAVHPLGAYAYVVNGDGTVAMYAIHATTGALAPLSPPTVAAGILPSSIAFAPSGAFAYVSNAGSNDVNVYSVDPATGALDAVEVEPAGAGTRQIAVTPDGSLAFAANEADDTISSFTIDALTGELSPGATSPFALAVGAAPRALAVDPGSDFLYVANSGDDTASQLAIGAGGVLSSIAPGPADAGAAPVAIGIDPSGDYVYVVGSGDASIRMYDVSGALAAAGVLVAAHPFEVRARAQPSSIAIQPSVAAPVFVTAASYVPNFFDNDVSQFALAGGELTALVPIQVQGGASPTWAAVHPTLPITYVANATGATGVELVSLFSIGVGGQLTPDSQFDGQLGDSAWSIHLDPSGRFAYIVTANSPSILPFVIDPVTGALSAGTSVPAGSSIARSGTVHPAGGYFYVSNQVDQNVGAYAIDPVTGALSPIGTGPTGADTAPFAVAVDPTGRFAYAACRGNNDGVACFTIDSATGALTPLATSPFALAGIDVVDLAISPSSRFLFAANLTDETVTVFLIGTDPKNASEDGTLFALATVPVGGPPNSLRVDASGTTLYVGIQGPGGGIEAYALDASGGMTLTDAEPTSDNGRAIGLLNRVQ